MGPLPLADGLKTLIMSGYRSVDEVTKKALMHDLVSVIGCEEYLSALQKVPVVVPAALVELGPLLRLQILFKLINECFSKMTDIKFSVSKELFRNIE